MYADEVREAFNDLDKLKVEFDEAEARLMLEVK